MGKEHGFLKGAAVLSIAGIVVKILGAIYRIPLSNIIKSEGMGYYQTAYPLYTLLLTVATAGFPVAIAKLVSEKRSEKNYKAAHQVFKVALIFLSAFGILSSSFLFLNARRIVENIGNAQAFYALVALAPALFFVPIMAVLRGYFQGSQNMVPTALSQMSEQFFRVVSGLVLTLLLLDKGIPIAAGGASMGGTIGALAGTLAIGLIYLKRRKEILKEIETSPVKDIYPARDVIRDLLKIAIPITIGAAIIPIMDSIDLKLVMNRLQVIGFTEKVANELYGNYKGMAQTLINLPQVFAVAISVSLVPAVSTFNSSGDLRGVKKIIMSGIKMTLLIGLPAAVGLFILSQPIIELLYYKNTAETIAITGRLLKISSIGVIFLTGVQSLSAILQGLGNPLIPAVNLFIGASIKAVLTYVLTGLPKINIYGAAFSTVVAYGIAFILDLIAVRKYSGTRIGYKEIFKSPLISALGMGLAVKIFHLLVRNNLTNTKATLLSILVGGISYVVLLVVTGALGEEELKLIPKGDKILEIINKVENKFK